MSVENNILHLLCQTSCLAKQIIYLFGKGDAAYYFLRPFSCL